MPEPQVARFLDRVAADGAEFSEAKVPALDDPDRHVVILDEEGIVAVGACARHLHADGDSHVAVETVVDRSMQFAAFEQVVVSAVLELVSPGTSVSVWSRRSSLDAALRELGFDMSRSLAFMAGELPTVGEPIDDRPMHEHEWPDIVEINNRAFADHREAGSLTVADAQTLIVGEGFDPEGVRVVERNGEILAFCWTKVHANGDGEIYRIAVDPAHHGRGLGRDATLAGYRWLGEQSGVERATLWVDEDNEAAMRLYRGLGLESVEVNREFTRS